MQEIDERFHHLADRVAADQNLLFDATDLRDVNRFYALWWHRSRRRSLETEFLRLKGVTASNFTDEDQEDLERHGVISIRQDGTVAARHINGAQMQIQVQRFAHDDLAGLEWRIIASQKGEFVVPDVPIVAILPITPKICLTPAPSNGTMTDENLSEVNRVMIAASRNYYFARDLRACA